MSIHLPPSSALVAISDKIGIPSSILIFVALVAATFLWRWLKENGYLLKTAAVVLIFLIIVQLFGPQKMYNFIFLGALLGWVVWKIKSDKNKTRAQLQSSLKGKN